MIYNQIVTWTAFAILAMFYKPIKASFCIYYKEKKLTQPPNVKCDENWYLYIEFLENCEHPLLREMIQEMLSKQDLYNQVKQDNLSKLIAFGNSKYYLKVGNNI